MTLLPIQSPVQCVLGTPIPGASPEHETGSSPQSSAKDSNSSRSMHPPNVVI
jgi:hypothetical protein